MSLLCSSVVVIPGSLLEIKQLAVYSHNMHVLYMQRLETISSHECVYMNLLSYCISG